MCDSLEKYGLTREDLVQLVAISAGKALPAYGWEDS